MSEPNWIPLGPSQLQVPTPVDGMWAKAENGAVAWRLPSITPPIPSGTITPDTAWHIVGAAGEPPYENGWQAWPDGNYMPARFRKMLDGMVILEGLIGGAGSAGGGSLAVFTLPVGYRPARHPHHYYTAASAGPAPWGTFWVMPDGKVSSEKAGAGVYIALNGIAFLAA